MTSSHEAKGHDTRELARKFATFPTPQLANTNLQERWHCSRSTVDRIRRAHGHRSDGPADSHPVVDLLTVLEWESVTDPVATWALGSDEDRKILAAPLLSIEDIKLLDRAVGGHHSETFRRRARSGKRPGIRVGRRWLFRPTIEEIARLIALRDGPGNAE